MMRLPLALASLCALLLAAGCNPTVSFDTTATGQGTIPGSSLGALSGPLALTGLSSISFNGSGDFKNNNTDKDHITSVKVKSISLQVTSPSGQDLSFFSSLAFSIGAASQPTIQIAHQSLFPKGQSTVQMTVDPAELAPYAKADSFSIGATGSGTSPPQDTTISVTMVMTVEAHVL
jgi:hypothetical protein